MSQTVLYIEDSPDNARLVERLLRRVPDTELLVAASAAEGVRAAADARPALILLDNNLPDGTGADVLGQLAAQQAAGIPVIIVSGDSGGQLMTDLRAAGAADFLPKPFDIQQFLGLMERYLPPSGGSGGQ